MFIAGLEGTGGSPSLDCCAGVFLSLPILCHMVYNGGWWCLVLCHAISALLFAVFAAVPVQRIISQTLASCGQGSWGLD